MESFTGINLETIKHGILIEVTSGLGSSTPLEFLWFMRRLVNNNIETIPFLVTKDGKVFILVQKDIQTHKTLVKLLSLELHLNDGDTIKEVRGMGRIFTGYSSVPTDYPLIEIQIDQKSIFYQLDIGSIDFGGSDLTINDFNFLTKESYVTLHF